jgi:hypothetical protein
MTDQEEQRNMHLKQAARATERIWQISLEQIEATVSEFLGPGRVKRNKAVPTFSRHVSMYGEARRRVEPRKDQPVDDLRF